MQVIHTSYALSNNDYDRVNTTVHDAYVSVVAGPDGRSLFALAQVSH